MPQAKPKFLFFPMGSAGDVYPFIGLALAMQQRGHDVMMLTSGYFAETCTNMGLPFVDTLPAADFEALINDPDLWHPRRSIRAIFHRCVSPHVRPQYHKIAELANEGPVVVVASTLGFGARVAQEHLGIPLITVHLQPAILWSDHQPPVLPGVWANSFVPRWLRRLQIWAGERFVMDPQICPAVNRLRAELGLPPIRRILSWWNSPDAILALYPDWYAPRQPDWPPQLGQADFPIWDAPTAGGQRQSLDAACQDFLNAGPAPVVFTAGSANRFGEYLFRIAGDVCRQRSCRGLLVTKFKESLPAALPPELLHVPYAPFSALLPHASAIVHHGGIGTTVRALSAGIPQVIVPLAHDQFDNGHRVQTLGVGKTIYRNKLNANALASELQGFEEDHRIDRRLNDLKERVQVDDSFAKACQLILGAVENDFAGN